MRYVPADQLQPGMVLGQGLHDASGRMLLAANTSLTGDNITYIKFLGTAGVYIDDEITRDIQLSGAVRPEVKSEAVSIIQQFFCKSTEDVEVDVEERLVRLVVENVVNDVLANEDVMYNMVDIKTYNDYTYFHSMNTGVMAGILGVKMDLPEEDLNDLVTAAFLHDIGKVFVLPELVNAQRKLTPAEEEEMKKHAWAGYEYLRKDFSFGERVNEAVYQHHEWYNGGGYPNHLRGRELSRHARIIKAADVYDTMTSQRPGYKSYQPAEVIEYIMSRTGMEFDPKVVETMVAGFCIYPVGSEVVLSDGRHAVVVENHPGFIQRPTVRLLETGEEINLRGDRNAYNITIVKLMV
ncbi:MAG: HD-GYP domain-containing protein [Pseudobutyrivibrio sp.]|nr:HD-GYP domain-containing protein [Pseudobutyrivibrio sp.]